MILIGTSGWSYRHWSGGAFYPKGLASGRWFEYYVRRFATVELNASFYRLPSAEVVGHWRELAPSDFAFSAKGSRLITHARRMKGCEAPLLTFMERLGQLGEMLSVVLWQLPRTWSAATTIWLGSTHSWSFSSDRVRHAVEFRHPSWLSDEAFSVLSDLASPKWP